jgi:hypothetical protein
VIANSCTDDNFAMSAATAFLSSRIGLAWVRCVRDIVPLRTLALAPIYVMRKVPLYLGFLAGRQPSGSARSAARPDVPIRSRP